MGKERKSMTDIRISIIEAQRNAAMSHAALLQAQVEVLAEELNAAREEIATAKEAMEKMKISIEPITP